MCSIDYSRELHSFNGNRLGRIVNIEFIRETFHSSLIHRVNDHCCQYSIHSNCTWMCIVHTHRKRDRDRTRDNHAQTFCDVRVANSLARLIFLIVIHCCWYSVCILSYWKRCFFGMLFSSITVNSMTFASMSRINRRCHTDTMCSAIEELNVLTIAKSEGTNRFLSSDIMSILNDNNVVKKRIRRSFNKHEIGWGMCTLWWQHWNGNGTMIQCELQQTFRARAALHLPPSHHSWCRCHRYRHCWCWCCCLLFTTLRNLLLG